MLMFIYDIDRDRAFDLLKWRSQATDVKLYLIAEQLIEDLAGIARDDDLFNVRSACDDVLMTVHERVNPASDPS
jgi:hypothetical protein